MYQLNSDNIGQDSVECNGDGLSSLTSWLSKNGESVGAAVDNVGSIASAAKKAKAKKAVSTTKSKPTKTIQPTIVLKGKSKNPVWGYIAIGGGVLLMIVTTVLITKLKK